MSDDPVARYLADLDRRLRGRPNRQRLLAEAEDHLRESQARLCESGMDADQAAREAVARIGPSHAVARAGGGRVATAAVVLLGAATSVALIVASAITSPPYQDAPSPALPLHLLFGAFGAAVVTGCLAYSVRKLTDPSATRGAAVRGFMLTAAVGVSVGLGEVAIHEAKQRLFTMYCVRDGVAPHRLMCNPQGARDMTTAELHGLVFLGLAAAVMLLAAFLIHRHWLRDQRRAGAA